MMGDRDDNKTKPTAPNQSEKPTRCDLIDRQAAIEAINTWDKFGVDERSRVVRWCEGLEPYVRLRDVVTSIAKLPSAQPDHSGDVNGKVSFTEKERRMLKKMRTLYNGTYADLLDRLVASTQEDADSAYTEGYTQAEAKYRALWDEMQANIKEKAFGKRKGLVHTADIDVIPSAQPERKNDIIQKFHDYQIEWLKSHYDLELEPRLEESIIRFLHDTANAYMLSEDERRTDG